MRFKLIILVTTILFLSSCNQTTVRMEGFEVHGIDVSHYQSDINWDVVAAQKIHFAFVKASEGETISDHLFCKNWASIKDAGIKRGAYHFFRPKTSVLTQAQNFMDNVLLEDGDLPPVLDVEVTDGVSEENLVKRIRTWLEIIELHFQIRPIIYTNLKFYNNYIADEFPDYKVWVARYNRFIEPKLINNQEWLFWQYGNKGRLDGIKGDVDFNVFRGTLQDLDELSFKYEPSLSLQ